MHLCMYADVHPYVNCIYIYNRCPCVFVCAVLRMTNIYVSGESWGIPGSFLFPTHVIHPTYQTNTLRLFH